MKYALISTKNDDAPEGLLDRKIAADVAHVLKYIERNLTVTDGGKNYSYVPDLYLAESPYHLPNEIITIFLENFKDDPSTTLKSRLRYPVTKLYGYEMYLPFAFGGVKLEGNSSRIASLKSILMRYSVLETNDTMKHLSDSFEIKLEEFSTSLPSDSELDVTIYSWDSLVAEVRLNTWRTLRYVPGAMILVLIFTLIVCSSLNMETSCHFHAIAGLISVVMSFISGLGLVFYFDIPYNDLVSVTSFLALAIGVDDTFIMIAAWKRFGRPGRTTSERLEATLAEAGSSITFTSITDVTAFSIGISMKLPALQHFCLFTATAILFDFFYQITFFPAIMIFCEELRPLSKYLMSKVVKSSTITTGNFEKVHPVPLKSEKQSDTAHMYILKIPSNSNLRKTKKYKKPFADSLYKLVTNRVFQTSWLVAVIAAAAFCLVGTANIRPSASFSKLLVDDAKTQAYVHHYDKYYWSEALLYHVIVQSPDFRNSTDVFYFLDLVNRLEFFGNYSVGSDSTSLWLRKFFDYLQLFDIGYDNLAVEVDAYLKQSPNPDVRTEARLLPSGQAVDLPVEFYFSTGMWGLDNWPARAKFLNDLSDIKAEYPTFSPAFFSEPIFLTDLLIYSKFGLSQTLGIVLICTFFITLLFLPWDKPILVFWVSTSFLTINGCVIGFLSWWSVDIDIVSMVTLLMSVGFSVDYTVHMAYQFSRCVSEIEDAKSSYDGDLRPKLLRHANGKKDVADAVYATFRAVLQPIFCSGISTLVAVSLMSFVQSYMIRVFVKTVFTVVLLGLAQSLVILPIIFILTARLVPVRTMRETTVQ